MRVIPIVLFLLLLGACQPAADPGPAMLTDADKVAIDAKTQAFVNGVNAGDWAAVAATYTEDAILLPPNAPAVRGPSAIEAFFAEFPPISDFTITNTEVEGAGDVAYVVGTYSMTITPEGAEPIHDTGKFIEIRKKQADGSWPLHRDMYSSDAPAPAPPPAQ
jgi:uncharacterized protein (TIGR02246 family)